MKHTSETPLAPYSYARCFNTQCTKGENCLHRLAAIHDTPKYPSISIINPLCIPEDTNQCSFFQSTQKIHVAWGISHLFDEVPHKNVPALKSQLIAHFGRGKYYRFYREEYFLTPEDQEYIRRLFQQYGLKEDVTFDSYSNEYRW